MIYKIYEKPPLLKALGYALQQLLAVFVATTLIPIMCGTPVPAAMVGGCIGTLVYQLITGFKSPMFISSCGATVSAVIGALAIGTSGMNYVAVMMGGAMIAILYIVMGLIVEIKGIDFFNRLFPLSIVGAVTVVIGLNLAGFIPTYVLVGGEHSNWGIAIALIVMLVVAASSHYFKGFAKTIPFLIGLLVGYIISLVLTLIGVAPIIDLSVFQSQSFFSIPDFAFMHIAESGWEWNQLGSVALLFIPVGLCALLEHYSDHKVLSGVIGVDLTETPGLRKSLWGDGIASFIGTIICGLPNTSYGESIATIGYSKVASVFVTTIAAIMLGVLAFITPVQQFIASIPSCAFGGCAIILYGYIAASGLKTLKNVDLNNQKNLIIVCAVLTIGVSSIWFLSEAFVGVSLAMVSGVILNLILKDKKETIS